MVCIFLLLHNSANFVKALSVLAYVDLSLYFDLVIKLNTWPVEITYPSPSLYFFLYSSSIPTALLGSIIILPSLSRYAATGSSHNS